MYSTFWTGTPLWDEPCETPGYIDGQCHCEACDPLRIYPKPPPLTPIPRAFIEDDEPKDQEC
jgi:hypothetical protein